MPKAKKSKQMDKLYGKQYSQKVFNRLEELDPELNVLIQSVAYDTFWGRKGLSVRDKSLITIAALIAMGKEEQTRIHMNGFLNAGGTQDEVRSALLHLAVYCGFPAIMNGFAAFNDVKKQRGKNEK